MAAAFGFLSTHPPTRCGLATFNSALAVHLTADGRNGGIVRVTSETDTEPAAPGVVHTWPVDSRTGWLDAASALGNYDVAVVQHEYGIYPGPDGQDVLPLLQRLTVPSIVVLHTVLTHPTARQKQLLEQIVAASGAVVVMTRAAYDRLLSGYNVDAAKVNLIPHGTAEYTGAPADVHTRPHLLTWGLIGPGKGIEWAIQALSLLRDLDPAPVYTVAGKTHPKVLERHGEAYRSSLEQLATELGVRDALMFDPVYRDLDALNRLIRSADVVVLPYDSREQVTSGVLIDAVGAGIPVVATPFPHAVELLTDGPGLIVPFGDPDSLADALRRLLTEPGLAARLTGGARPSMLWPAVAARYEAVAHRLLAARDTVLAEAPS